MESELEPRVKPLPFKVKAMSRESPAQKAANVLDADLRNHWSTATNAKEWILLELDEACLLSHIRIYNKSVIEWEITVGLRFKPEAFIKVRPRCEAPRRDMTYPTNYSPCRYVRISCLRGNPIALFFIQLIGVPVPGLEPEFQPLVNHLLPYIISHKQDANDLHLQLLKDMTSRLSVFLPVLETDLTNMTDAADSNLRFFAMLTGPFYPILQVANERESSRAHLNLSDLDASRYNNSSTFSVSSNFEVQPRRSRCPIQFVPSSSFVAFRRDAVIILLRKAYNEHNLGIVCRSASKALQRLAEPVASPNESVPSDDLASSAVSDELTKIVSPGHLPLSEYSGLFGEEFATPDEQWDSSYLNVLDVAAVEEGIFHVLYACGTQPLLCGKLADNSSEFWCILPLVQALLPVLRPSISSPPDLVDDGFGPWKHPTVQSALCQIVAMASSPVYHPLLHACAGYLSSFLCSHAKAACVLIDLCSGPLFPWLHMVVAKVDLAVELLEDLLGVIQDAHHSISRGRAALKYLILALSGHVDDVLAKFKEFKHKLLFLLEMLEPFIDRVIATTDNTISSGDVSTKFMERQKSTFAIAVNIIRTAVQKPMVLPSLESEWRQGSVAPSVLLSVLVPHLQLPLEIDLCTCNVSSTLDQESFFPCGSSVQPCEISLKPSYPEVSDGRIDGSEPNNKISVLEGSSHFFSPSELKKTPLLLPTDNFFGYNNKFSAESIQDIVGYSLINKFHTLLSSDSGFSVEYFNLQANYLQLVNHRDCESRASEFQRLATDLSSQCSINPEGHEAAIDALLLAAECYINPFFMMTFRLSSTLIKQIKDAKLGPNNDIVGLTDLPKNKSDLERIAHLEIKRDKTVLQILLQAAKLDAEYHKDNLQGELYTYGPEGVLNNIEISQTDFQSADAVTLVRQNQSLLCYFIVNQLQRNQLSSHEVLLQNLLFILHSATELACSPEIVVDIILRSADDLNRFLIAFYNKKDGNVELDQEKLLRAQRRWVLLQGLVVASSGSCDGEDLVGNVQNRFQYRTLVPPSSWMLKISNFRNSPFPLTRFLGWMAVSRYAKQYIIDRLCLAADLPQLSSLLSIFVDELAIDIVNDRKVDVSKMEPLKLNISVLSRKEHETSYQSDVQGTFPVLYPYLHKFFPCMNEKFRIFEEIILEAVGLQLKCLPHSVVPDLLFWFSELCLSPFPGIESGEKHSNSNNLKGFVAVSAKTVILYVLESILGEHMEAMLPEMPMIAQILISLCKTTYCDVPFLDSVICLLRPLISFFLKKATADESHLSYADSNHDFELINFEELFSSIRCRNKTSDGSGECEIQGSLMIFVLGSLFIDLSFRRRSEILSSLLLWTDFSTTEPACSFYDYLCAFQKVICSCNILIVENLEYFGIQIPVEDSKLSEGNSFAVFHGKSDVPRFSNGAECSTRPVKDFGELCMSAPKLNQGHCLSLEEIKEFSERLESLILDLFSATEVCWKMHYKLATAQAFTLARCSLFVGCLRSVSKEVTNAGDSDGGGKVPSFLNDGLSLHWNAAMEGLTDIIMLVLKNRCWQVASSMLDYLMSLPQNMPMGCVIGNICAAIKQFCLHAPRISWRLQTDKWLSSLFNKGISDIDGSEVPLVDLFCTMLGHPEPEQRAVALQHMGRIVGLNFEEEVAKFYYELNQSLVESNVAFTVPARFVSVLVSKTWDMVATLSVTDSSMLLRTQAKMLLSGYVPFVDRNQLQSFLISTNTLFQGFGTLSPSFEEVHLTKVSLCLLASVCLHSHAEDVALIPESVWKKLQSMASSRHVEHDSMERNVCVALCKLRNQFDEAKGLVKEALVSGSASMHNDPDFKSTRESILQVLSSLTSVQSYFDFFSKRTDEEAQELEEAEIEMDLLQMEKSTQEVIIASREGTLPYSNHMKDSNRLEKIKDDIRSLEKSRVREHVVARRHRKFIMRQSREKYLEEMASREKELLQQFDRERANELEREIERRRLLEAERAKTREMQYNLDMEREKQTQRELQHELEQVESGVRSRRDFSSNTTRPRYRERDAGRSGHQEGGRGREGGGGSGGGAQGSAAGPNVTSTAAPTVVLAAGPSRSMLNLGQNPTILQARDRADQERGVGYDESFEGGRDSGDASSAGDPELASAFDGSGGGGFGSVAASRQGPRGGKSSRQASAVERRDRDRDTKREGKWERKH